MADTSKLAFTVRVGRAFDYVLGRNTLIGIASIMLLLISGYATWHGMRDFIVGVAAGAPQANPNSVSSDTLVVAIVIALTFLMWLALRETFGARRKVSDRLITGALYFFLAMWSIGFGYGFWWSLISGEEATRSGLSGLQEDARDAAQVVQARLDAVRSQIDSVVSWSDSQMAREESSGGSCGKASGAGRGPLYNARRSVRDSITTLRDGMVRSWLEPVRADVEQLRQSAADLQGGSVEERQKAFEAKASEIRGKARNITARSNELGKSTAAEMRAIAASVSVAPDQPGFTCYDQTLGQRLQQAAEQADQPAVLKLREAVFNEGPAGVANAVKNLWKNIGTYGSGLVAYVGSRRDGPRHTDGGEPITGRDLIALLATIGVDLGLLVLAILNPPPAETRRLSGKEERDIQEAIHTAIKRAPGKDMEWVRCHFLHHNKHSYLVIPNLSSARAKDEDEGRRALAINQLAGVLGDMELVRWPEKAPLWKFHGQEPWWWPFGRSELRKLKDEESVASDTDITDIHKQWLEKLGNRKPEIKDDPKNKAYLEADPLRNHGLFSKAERALSIAGWSDEARRDVEIFRLVDVAGLTPLLQALSKDLIVEEADKQTAGTTDASQPA